MANSDLQTALNNITTFLRISTPQAWLDAALHDQETLLIDHANCEKKAAGTALSLMYRYLQYPDLLQKLSRLAREELRHFEQVLAIMQKRGIDYKTLTASRYAQRLRKAVRTHEPAKLIDTLITGAIIEARSCERFAAIYPHLDTELSTFYYKLLSSEARHYQLYLDYAKKVAVKDIQARINHFLDIENELITSQDTEFRFHSGCPHA